MTTIQPTARYEGAGQGRRLASWSAPSTGPVATTTPAIQTLRNRVRDLVRNDAIAASAVRVLVNSIVGFGIQCRSTIPDKEAKKRLTNLWNEWAKTASTCGLDFYGLQVLIVRAMVTDGEAFIRLRHRRPDDGLAVPFQLEALEADMLPMLTTEVWPGLPEGHQIVQGVEIDGIGRRVAFWFHKQHPGERMTSSTVSSDLTRVPAESVLHIFEPQRIGQVRGVSPFAPVITRLKNVSDYDDGVIERLKLANLFVAFVTKPLPSGSSDVMTGLPLSSDFDAPLAGLEPGLLQELLPGESMEFSSPPDAGAAYSEFMRQQYLTIGAAIGVPPEMLTGELRDISDRTLRFSVGEFRRRVEQIVWTVLVPRFLNPVREAFGFHARLSGAISEADYKLVTSCTWAIHAHAFIHPTQDIAARKAEVDAGFRSRASVISERGDDPDEVDQERADDAARASSLNLSTGDEKLVQAQIEKLNREAEAAERAAQASQQQAAEARARAQAATAEATRTKQATTHAEGLHVHSMAEAKARSRIAALEIEAVNIGLKELKGGAK